MKILTVVGARPQFVKAAVISRELAKYDDMSEVIVHTGQHFDVNMSDVFFDEMAIPKPKYNLDIHGLNHGAMTGQMLEGIERIILDEKPDLVLVYGDTNSTLAGALAAKKLHVKIAHVEAGLRSFNMQMPEEVNRILTDRISDYLYCPTTTAIDNLNKEGYANIDADLIHTGDVMQDAAYFYANQAEEKSRVLSALPFDSFALCTLHRAENTDHPERLREIVNGLNQIHRTHPIVLPLHPRTKAQLNKQGLTLNVHLIDPVGYFDMIALLQKCSVVLTDSGGLQKEAFFFKKNCVTLRDQTEWVELIEHGLNVLAEAKSADIEKKFEEMLGKENNFEMDLYGGGKAGANIVNHIRKELA